MSSLITSKAIVVTARIQVVHSLYNTPIQIPGQAPVIEATYAVHPDPSVWDDTPLLEVTAHALAQACFIRDLRRLMKDDKAVWGVMAGHPNWRIKSEFVSAVPASHYVQDKYTLSNITTNEPTMSVEDFPSFYSQDIWELDMSVRATNVLREEGINYVGDLIQKTGKELKSFPNLGKKTLIEIQEALAAHHLELGMRVEYWPPADLPKSIYARN